MLVIGLVVIWYSALFFIRGQFTWHYFAAGEFIGLLLLGYSVKWARDRFSVRGLWRKGQIVPGAVITPPRLPYIGVVVFNVAVTSVCTLSILNDWELPYLIGAAVTLVVLERVSRRLNSAEVFYVVDGEELVARLPMDSLWRRVREEDCIWVAALGKRSAALHLAGPIAPEFAFPGQREQDWIIDRMEAFLVKEFGAEAVNTLLNEPDTD